MTDIRWNALKSKRLKRTRGVSFEEIIKADLVDIADHSKREHQKIFVYEYKNYLWAVPFVIQEDGGIFLKTLYPDRKLMKKYNKER